jgi:uncharacterized protein (UPF0332 family)
MNAESRLYIEYARRDLRAAASNLDMGYLHVVVSRAYYAMLYAASALLSSKGITRSKHSGVLSAFGEYYVKTGLVEPEYAKMIGRAFDSRLDSDYDVVYQVDQSTAEKILIDAQRFVERVEDYFAKETSGEGTH